MTKLFAGPDFDSLEEIIVPDRTILEEIPVKNSQEFAAAVSGLQNLADKSVLWSSMLMKVSADFLEFSNWYQENIALPEKHARYSWICSGILLLSLGLSLLLVLLK